MTKNALVVHPDNATRILLERWVRREGYATRSVPSGEEALRVASRGRVDLIVLDRLAPDAACADVILTLVAPPRVPRVPFFLFILIMQAAGAYRRRLAMCSRWNYPCPTRHSAPIVQCR